MPQNIEEKGRWQLTFPDVPRTYHLSCFFCMLGHKTVDFVFSFALSVFFPFTYRFFFEKEWHNLQSRCHVALREDRVYSVHVAPIETLFTKVSRGLEKWLDK